MIVSNTGTRNAAAISIQDVAPSGTSFVAGSAQITADTSGGSVTSFVGDEAGETSLTLDIDKLLGNGGSVTVTFQVAVDTPTPADLTIDNTAQVSYGASGPVTVTSNSASITVDRSPILGATKTVSDAVSGNNDGLAQPGEVLTYTLVVSNVGDGDASGVSITDAAPSGTTFVAGSAQITTDNSGGSVTSFIGDDAGESNLQLDLDTLARLTGSITITFQVTVDSPVSAALASIDNTAQVSADGIAAFDSNSTSYVVDAAVNLGITKAVSDAASGNNDGAAQPGETLTYTLVVSNTGNRNAANVSIQDLAPAGTSFVAGSALVTADTSGGSITTFIGNDAGETSLQLDLDTLAGGGAITVTFQVLVDATVSAGLATISNTAQLSASGVSAFDSNAADVTVDAAANLSIHKSGSDASSDSQAQPGEVLTYTLVVSNTGNRDAANVSIQDLAPTGTSFVAGSALVTANSTGGTITTFIGDNAGETSLQLDLDTLAGGGGAITVTFQALVDTPVPAGVHTISNTAQLSASGVSTFDSNVADIPVEQSFVLTGPTSGTYTAGAVVSIAWTAGGVVPGSTISLGYDEDTIWWNGNEHWIEVDQVAAADGSHTYDWNTAGVASGTYYVMGYMYDSAGTFTPSHLTQAISIQEPSFVLTAPTSGTFAAGDTVSIQWTAGNVAPGSTISLGYDEDTIWWNGNEHWIEIDQVAAANGNHTYDWDTTGVTNGTYYVLGYMYDSVSTFTLSHLTQAITIEGASFDLTAPTSGTFAAGDTVSIQWTAGNVAPGSTISLGYDEDTIWWNGNEHWIEVDQVAAANGSHSYDWDTTGVASGTYYVMGYMYDSASTSFTLSHLTQAIDIQGPSFVLTAPTSGTYTTGDTVSIQWTAGNVVPGSTITLGYDEDTTWWNGNEHWIEVDQVAAADGSHSYNWDTTGVASGTYYVMGYMYDSVSTFTLSHLTQAIDIQGQSFALTAPTSGTFTAGDTVSIQWTAGNVVPGSTITLGYDEDTNWWNGNEHWIEVDQVAAANGSHSYDWDTTGVAAGSYYVMGYLYDSAGTFTPSQLTQAVQIQAAGGGSAPATSGAFRASTSQSPSSAGTVVSGNEIGSNNDEDTVSLNDDEHTIEVDQVVEAGGAHAGDPDTSGVASGTYDSAGNVGHSGATVAFSDRNDSILTSGSPLMLEGGGSIATDLVSLDVSDLQPIASYVIERWAETALGGEQWDSLQNVTFVVTDLPGQQLGWATFDTIYIDVNAAGQGWFIDATPQTNEEFQILDGQLRALEEPAVDRIDLLTVLYHELGHVLGLADVDPEAGTLMGASLTPGVRREPNETVVDMYFSQSQ